MAARWQGIVDAGCDTVLAAVAWEQVEPEAGRFDLTAVDELLAGARAHGLRLVLLWFGRWENVVSRYVPAVVCRDSNRFPREGLGRFPRTVLSPFSAANLTPTLGPSRTSCVTSEPADGRQHTVVMVQVENEVGIMPEPVTVGAG